MSSLFPQTKTGLAAALCAVLAATAVAAPASAQEKTIATVVKLAGDPWWNRMEEGIEEFSEAHEGVRVFQQGPSQADAALQAQLIEDLIAQQVDALSVVPLSPQTLEPVLQKAKDAGIIVVMHEGETQPTKDFDIEAFDNEAYGCHLMDEMASRMGESGEYAVYVGKLTNVTHNQWVDAAIACQEEKYPDMTHVGDKIVTDEDAQTAYRKTQELLVSYPNIKGFQGSSSNDVVGIGQAVEEAGLAEPTSVVGTSLVSLAGNLLETDAVDMIGFWDPKLAGMVMSEVALRLLNGETIEDGADLGVEGYEEVSVSGDIIKGSAWVDVTKENMADYDF